MPSMKEIYSGHAAQYDELVSHEDYEDNLKSFLRGRLDFEGKTVVEFGAGTGRLTGSYIDQASSAFCLDQSRHMLEVARQNLRLFRHKLQFLEHDNVDGFEPIPRADIAMEGWAFGHTVIDHCHRIPEITELLVANCLGAIRETGIVVIIETMGTGVESAAAPRAELRQFYEVLETRHGFERTIVPTDYRFDDVDSASRIMGFFFGDEMGRRVKERGSAVVSEYTGVWLRDGDTTAPLRSPRGWRRGPPVNRKNWSDG